MKKLITAAALIAAGTAAAFAVTPPNTSDWSDVTFTLVGNQSSGASGTSVTSGRAGFSSLSIGGQSVTTLSASEYSWSLSFNISQASSYNGMLFSTQGGANGQGYSIGITNYDNTTATFKLCSGGAAWGQKANPATLTGSLNDMLTLTWDASASKLYFGVGDSYAEISTSSLSSLALSSTTSVSGTSPQGSIFWTNGGAQQISNITLKAKANVIPEPSAFGLLAGIGALALVASRRRRR